MEKLLLKLMVLAALAQLGMSLGDLRGCGTSRGCLGRLEKASREVLEIDWKPISVFSEEGRRFR